MRVFNEIINKFRGLLTGTNRNVTGNFFYLSLLNAINIILPLITLPYLMKTVGKANYGIYSYVYTVIGYVIMFATYGFNYTATKQISQCRDDHSKVNAIFNSVIASKFLIGILLSLIIILAQRFVFKDDLAPLMFLFGLGMVFGDVITPVWLFQGMEQMKYVTIVNATSKILFTLLVFIVIRNSDDYYLLIGLNSTGYLLAGILSMILARRQFGMKLGLTSLREIKYQFKEGGSVFGSTLGMYLYRNANVLILKQFASNDIVGIYSAAEKVIKGFQSLVSPAAQALFPHFSLKFKSNSDRENLHTLKRVAVPFAVVVLVISIGVYVCAPVISDILCGGKEFRDCVPLIRIMTLVILFGEINYLIGIVGLINLNRQKQFFRSVVLTGLFSVAFILIFAGKYGAYAAAASMSLSEMMLTVLCLVSLMSIIRTRNEKVRSC